MVALARRSPYAPRVEHLPDPVELAASLVRVPSVTGHEAAVQGVIARWCDAHGLDARLVDAAPGRPNLLIEVGSQAPDAPSLLLNGHVDVVPPGDGWTRDPWSGAVEGGLLHGRGACDMKAGVATMLAGLVAAVRAVPEPRGRVTLACVVDEEDGGLGTRRTIAAGLRADWAVIAEPTECRPVRAAKGNCYLEVRVGGVAAHAGAPDAGANAIHAAAEVVERVRALDRELRGRAHSVLTAPCTGVGTIAGGTGTAIVPDGCVLTIDRRLLPGEDGASALADLERVLAAPLGVPGATVSASLLMEMPAMETPAGHPLLAAIEDAMAAAAIPAAAPEGWTAACDGGFLHRDLGIPVVLLGPGSLRRAHRPDETCPVAEIESVARAYAYLAGRVLAGAPTA